MSAANYNVHSKRSFFSCACSAIQKRKPLFPPKAYAQGVEGSEVLLNQPLVDSHLKHIPRFATFTARRLAGGDLEDLGGEADGAFDLELLGLGALDELLADLFERLHLARGEGDADLVKFLGGRRDMLETGIYG